MSSRRIPRSRGFFSMSVWIEVTGIDIGAERFEQAVRRIELLADRWMATFSRFEPTSELSRLNQRPGEWVAVSTDLMGVLSLAEQARRETRGRFDPAVLPALERAGYRESIESIRNRVVHSGADFTADEHRPAVEFESGKVRLPHGMRVDLGGVAKGVFVDRAQAIVAGWPGGCIDAGGDMIVWGDSPDGDRWRIGIEHPADDATDLAVLGLPRGVWAIATSATNRRRWLTSTGPAHHLIDPESGKPVALQRVSATAVARTAATAEVETKQLIVAAGRGEAPELIGGQVAVVWSEGHPIVLEQKEHHVHVEIASAFDHALTA